MNGFKPSEVAVSLKSSEWKTALAALQAMYNDSKYDQYRDWIGGRIQDIQTAIDKFPGSENDPIPVVYSPPTWNSIIPLLKTNRKDPQEDAKRFLEYAVSSSVRYARQKVLVTNGDLDRTYEIVGPVYYQISNKGILSSQLSQLSSQYKAEIQELRKRGQIGEPRIDWGVLYGEFSAGQGNFETAFYIAVQELKKRAHLLVADAVIFMRQDIDLDTSGFQFFYLQMYGTAVRYK